MYGYCCSYIFSHVLSFLFIHLFQCISNFAHTWRARCVLINGAPMCYASQKASLCSYNFSLHARARAGPSMCSRFTARFPSLVFTLHSKPPFARIRFLFARARGPCHRVMSDAQSCRMHRSVGCTVSFRMHRSLDRNS